MAASKVHLSDSESFRALVEQMRPDDYDEFESYRGLALESAFPGRVLVVYTLQGGRPTNIEVVKIGEIVIQVMAPPTVHAHHRGRVNVVGVVPKRLADRDVFLSVPQNFVFKWAGQRINGNLEFRPHYALLIKTAHKDTHKVDGCTYCVALKRFKEQYPELADHTRF